MDLQGLQEWARFAVPHSAQNLHYEVSEGIDNLALIRFQISKTDLPVFIAALGFSKPLRQNYYPFPPLLTDDPDWWRPEQIQTFVGGALLIPGLSRELLIAQDTTDRSTVFLRTYEVG